MLDADTMRSDLTQGDSPSVWDFTCLLIQQDGQRAQDIEPVLLACGIKTRRTRCASDAQSMLRHWAFDGIVLDNEGMVDHYLAVLRLLRRHTSAPIVLLTSIADEQRQVLDLDNGAADVMLKPASSRLLAAKLRRMMSFFRTASAAPAFESATPPPRRRLGNLTIDRRNSELRTAARALPLTQMESASLWLLADKAGEVVDRDALAKASGRTYRADDRTLDMMVLRLRRKLAAVGADEVSIDTVRHKGYRLVAWSDCEHPSLPAS